MTVPRPSSGAHSEEELLEQWEFLDRLVERQAGMLRAGVQDSEEVDEPAEPAAVVVDLEQQVVDLGAELTARTAERDAADARVDELSHRISALEAELGRAQRARAEAFEALRGAHVEVQTLRDRLETPRRRYWFRRRR